MSFIIRFQTIFVCVEYPESDRAKEFWKRYVSSASEKAFPFFFGEFGCCFTPSKTRCFITRKLTCSLSTVVVTAPHHTLSSICKNKIICVLGHCGVDTSHVRTSEGHCVFCWFVFVISRLSLKQDHDGWKTKTPMTWKRFDSKLPGPNLGACLHNSYGMKYIYPCTYI